MLKFLYVHPVYLCAMPGIYLHIPFCKQKCSYCDFHFSTRFSNYKIEMLQQMEWELVARQSELPFSELSSVYFGGGTPSILEATEIDSFIRKIQENWQLATDCEITLEANPDDITAEKVQAWKQSGINRLSIGLQSFDQEDLAWMNRAHSVSQSLNCIQIAQENGIENISIDLMYGLPNMDLDRWKKQIHQAISLQVQHISAYCLTVEAGTALDNWVKTNKITPASNDLQSEHFQLLIEELNQAGFIQYEISNFATSGFEAKHNSSYWKGEAYLGIGPSAHSFDGKKMRSWNIANNHQYIRKTKEKEAFTEREILDSKNQFNEAVLIGLRTKWGVDLKALNEILPLSAEFSQKLTEFSDKGWVLQVDSSITLTQEGKHWADHIASELFEL